MATKKVETEEVVQETGKEAKGSREARWTAHLEKYKISNPVKYEIKEKNGEFKEIPESFR